MTAKVGALRPRFDHSFVFNVSDYEGIMELNLYMTGSSENIPIGRRNVKIKDLFT